MQWIKTVRTFEKKNNLINNLFMLSSANKLRYGLPGAPSWRRLEAETEVYVYSAGCNSLPGDSSSPCPQVSVIALAAGDELLRGFKCKLWYGYNFKNSFL